MLVTLCPNGYQLSLIDLNAWHQALGIQTCSIQQYRVLPDKTWLHKSSQMGRDMLNSFQSRTKVVVMRDLLVSLMMLEFQSIWCLMAQRSREDLALTRQTGMKCKESITYARLSYSLTCHIKTQQSLLLATCAELLVEE